MPDQPELPSDSDSPMELNLDFSDLTCRIIQSGDEKGRTTIRVTPVSALNNAEISGTEVLFTVEMQRECRDGRHLLRTVLHITSIKKPEKAGDEDLLHIKTSDNKEEKDLRHIKTSIVLNEQEYSLPAEEKENTRTSGKTSRRERPSE